MMTLSGTIRAGGALLKRDAFKMLVLALLAFGVYARSLNYDLVWDDPQLNRLVATRVEQGGLSGLLSSRFEFATDLVADYYRPVVLFSLWANSLAPGGSPWAYHLTNLFLHVAATILVFLLVSLVAGSSRAGSIGAALFAVHPALTESVAFVSGRTDLLAAVFVLVATLVWERDRRAVASRPMLERAGGLVAFTLACLSKEVALMLPPVLLAWDALDPAPAPGGRGQGWWGRNAFWVAAWSVCLAAILAARGVLAGVSLGDSRLELPLSSSAWSLLLDRLATYARLLVFPWPLNAYYTRRGIGVDAASVIGCAVLFAIFLAAARGGRDRGGYKSPLWVALFLVPVLGIVPLAGAPVAERFLYLPMVGLVLAAGPVLDRLAARPGWRWPVLGATTGLVLIFAAGTSARLPVWRDDLTLYGNITKTSPDSANAFYNLGTAYQSRGRLSEAAAAYRSSLGLRPDDPQAGNNLGLTLQAAGQHVEAIAFFRQALLLKPDYPLALNNLGNSLQQVGQSGEAIESYLRALRLQPDNAAVYQNLGNVFLTAGRHQEAAEAYRRAIRLDPASSGARFGLGMACIKLGLREQALAEYRSLLAVEPAVARRLLKVISGGGPPARP
jgi:tetratricopeptide (TPR) repeat protein